MDIENELLQKLKWNIIRMVFVGFLNGLVLGGIFTLLFLS